MFGEVDNGQDRMVWLYTVSYSMILDCNHTNNGVRLFFGEIVSLVSPLHRVYYYSPAKVSDTPGTPPPPHGVEG